MRSWRSLLIAPIALLAVLPATATASPRCLAPSCEIPASLPLLLPFSGDSGGAPTVEGLGTGFTLVDESSRGGGLEATRLSIGTDGLLDVTTTPGIAFRDVNTQENMLGVTVPAAGHAIRLETSLISPPAASGGYEQAGLWYGTSEDDYVKLVVISRDGTRVHALHEGGGLPRMSAYAPVLATAPARVTLRLRIDNADRDMTASYVVDDGEPRRLGTWPLPASLSEAAAGGRRVSRAGLFATHRRGPLALVYGFDWFNAECPIAGCPPGPAPVDPGMGDGETPVGEPGDEVDPGDGDGGGGGAPSDGEPVIVTPPGDDSTPVPAAPVSGRAETPAPAGGLQAGRPWLRLGVPRKVTRKALRRRGLRVAVRCSEACVATIALVARARRVRRIVGRSSSLAAGQTRVRLDRRGLRGFRRARRITVRGRARFGDGSVATVKRRTRLSWR